MKGYMRQRGASWDLRVFVRYDSATGKQRYTYRSVRCSQREAQRLRASGGVRGQSRSICVATEGPSIVLLPAAGTGARRSEVIALRWPNIIS